MTLARTLAVSAFFLSLSANAATLKLALPGLTAVQLDDKLAAFLTEQLGVELEQRGADVVTSKEISTLLGFERQKELLNCADESSSCIAELGNALGADALVVGDVAKVGSRYQLTVKALSTSAAKSIASWSGGADSEDALLKLVAQAAAALAPQTARSTGRTLSAVEVGRTSRDYALYPAIAGGVLLVGAVAAEAVAYGHYQRLTNPRGLQHEEAVSAANSGKTWQSAFAVGATVGVAALAAAGAMYFMAGDRSGVSAVLTSEGAAVAFTAELP